MTGNISNEITLIHGDCVEEMKKMPDKSVDLVLTDPPYGIGMDGSKETIKKGVQIRKAYDFKGWDNATPPKEYFEEIFRVSKNQVICGANYFCNYLPSGHKGWVIWDKGQRDLTMSDCEIIFSSFQSLTKIYTIHRAKLWAEKPKHPTQKPIILIKYLLQQFSEKNQTILDPFMGSGTTGVACKELNRKFIGIEINKDYYEIAKKRISNTQRSML